MSEDKSSEDRNKVVASVADALIGAIDFSAEHVSNAINKLVERGKLSREEAGKVVKEISERGREQRQKLQEKLGSALSRMRMVSQAEHDGLAARVGALEKAIKADAPEES